MLEISLNYQYNFFMLNISYHNVFSLQNIYKAHLKCRQSKRKKYSIVKFEFNQLNNIFALYQTMKTFCFDASSYNSFVVYEPKRREIQTLNYGSRIIQRVLCNDFLMPYFSKRVVLDNAVCQKGKGMHFALKRFEYQLKKFALKNKNNGYVLKCDIKKFFPSISHKILIDKMCTPIKDKNLKKLVFDIIDGYHTNIEYLQKYDILPLQSGLKTGRGIPIGNQTSQIFGMFYLDELDRFVKEKLKIKIYSRYMDDFVIVCKDKQMLVEVFDKIKQKVESLQLTLNSSSQIFPLKNGVTYLGFRYFLNSNGKLVKKVKQQTIRRFKKRIKLLNRAYFDGAIEKDDIKSTLSAYHGHFCHSNSFKIEKKLFSKIKVKGVFKNDR